MSAPTPIKRSKELAPLSREHHEGLLFVFKIRQGLKLCIPENRIAGFCEWSWKAHFAPHFQKEETELVPVLEAAHPMIKQMLDEHIVIRDQFTVVKQEPAVATLESLAQLINDHIRFEERQLFPLIEQTATPEQMKAIEQSLAGTQHVCDPWRDEFWVAPK